MSIEKQKLYNEIDTLPEELTNQVIDFIEYLKFLHIENEAPDSVIIKSTSLCSVISKVCVCVCVFLYLLLYVL